MERIQSLIADFKGITQISLILFFFEKKKLEGWVFELWGYIVCCLILST